MDKGKQYKLSGFQAMPDTSEFLLEVGNFNSEAHPQKTVTSSSYGVIRLEGFKDPLLLLVLSTAVTLCKCEGVVTDSVWICVYI